MICLSLSNLAQDWAALPTDVLDGVVNKLFESPITYQWPLKAATSQLSALRLVCKHWAKALADKPPNVRLKLKEDDEYQSAECVMYSFSVKTLKLLH